MGQKTLSTRRSVRICASSPDPLAAVIPDLLLARLRLISLSRSRVLQQEAGARYGPGHCFLRE
jgi:hypothetical protein